MTKMAAQNKNKRVFLPGNVNHQIADLALAFHLIYSLSKAKKQLFRSTLRRKETSFELESLSWRLARSQAAWYRELAVGMTTFMYDVKFCKSSSLNSFYSARSSITPKATNVSISELLTRISCERLSQRPGGCHFLCCVHGALDDVRLKGEEQTRCAYQSRGNLVSSSEIERFVAFGAMLLREFYHKLYLTSLTSTAPCAPH